MLTCLDYVLIEALSCIRNRLIIFMVVSAKISSYIWCIDCRFSMSPYFVEHELVI